MVYNGYNLDEGMMNMNQYKSLFDIIGPVMVGPSSSHTAGAVRIASMALDIFGERPDSANIYLFESFAETFKGHGTDVALVGGLLGMEPDDERLHSSLIIAKDEGMDVKIIPLKEKVDHPNTARFVLRKGSKRMDIEGVSIGGGSALITKVDHNELEIKSGVLTIIISHQDIPGAIAKVANALSAYNLNIATMKVWRKRRGEEANMVIELDDTHSTEDLRELLEFDFINSYMIVGGTKDGIN